MRRIQVPVREHHHRFPRASYRGCVFAAFHACVLGRKRVFADGEVVATVRDMLSAAMEHHGCSILAYCFMPDHAHVVVRGRDAEADAWAGMVRWKGVSGRWLAKNTSARWQKDFYDSVLLVPEAVQGEIEYVLLNPVRNKMVSDWWDYPYSWRCE